MWHWKFPINVHNLIRTENKLSKLFEDKQQHFYTVSATTVIHSSHKTPELQGRVEKTNWTLPPHVYTIGVFTGSLVWSIVSTVEQVLYTLKTSTYHCIALHKLCANFTFLNCHTFSLYVLHVHHIILFTLHCKSNKSKMRWLKHAACMQFWLENTKKILYGQSTCVHEWMILRQIRYESVNWLRAGTDFCDNTDEPQGSKTK
jgi:hypothetical protein